MATTNRKTRAKRTQPKKCIQTTCGNTCIPKSKTCRITDSNTKKKIRQKGKELVDKLQGKNTAKTSVDRAVEKSVTKPKSKTSSKAGKLAYEKLTKESKIGTKRSKAETYNQGLAILGKYGGKDESRTRVDRDVEVASAKTRRKPQTENEKTQKVLQREEAQRVIRELQGGEKTKVKATKKEKDNLEDLFLKADYVGSKYQTKAEIEEYQSKLGKEMEGISKTIDKYDKEDKPEIINFGSGGGRISGKSNLSVSREGLTKLNQSVKLPNATKNPMDKIGERIAKGEKLPQAIIDKYNQYIQEKESKTPPVDTVTNTENKSKKRRTNLVDMDVATRKKFNFIGVDKETGKTNFAEIGLGRDRMPQLNQIQSYRLQRITDGTLPFATNQKVENILRDLRNPVTNFKRQGELLKQLDSLFNNGDE